MTELTHKIAGDALAGLQELPLPAPVPYTPQTVGWVVIAIVLVALVALVIWRVARHRRANAYRRAALAELAVIEREATVFELPVLLKRTAMAATSREHVAALTGVDWLRFLDRTLNTDAFTRGTGRLLTRIAYYDEGQLQKIPPADLQQLLHLSRRWIRHHHADV
jgi:Domain of unknown function (DUF4381)